MEESGLVGKLRRRGGRCDHILRIVFNLSDGFELEKDCGDPEVILKMHYNIDDSSLVCLSPTEFVKNPKPACKNLRVHERAGW